MPADITLNSLTALMKCSSEQTSRHGKLARIERKPCKQHRLSIMDFAPRNNNYKVPTSICSFDSDIERSERRLGDHDFLHEPERGTDDLGAPSDQASAAHQKATCPPRWLISIRVTTVQTCDRHVGRIYLTTQLIRMRIR